MWKTVFCAYVLYAFSPIVLGTTLQFINSGLDEFPVASSIPAATTELDVSTNNIQFIPENTLCHITALQHLSVFDNDFSAIGNISCVGHSLKILILTTNPLYSLPASALEGLDVLEELYAKNNRFTAFPELVHVADTLKILDLYWNPSMNGDVPQSELQQLVKLEHLNLVATGMTSNPDLSPVWDTLKILYLGWSDVKFEVVSDDAYPHVHTLSLEDANIKSLPDLNRLQNLQHLILNKNDLSSVSTEEFHKLPTTINNLDLDACSLNAMPDLSHLVTLKRLKMNNNPIGTISRNLICFSPELSNLGIANTGDTNAPCPCSTLENVHAVLNSYTQLPTIASCTRQADFYENDITSITAKHSATLSKLRRLDLRNNPLVRLEDYMNLDQDPNAELDIREVASLDLCKCEHVWIKLAQESGASISVDDVSCSGTMWSTLSTTQLLQQCQSATIKGNYYKQIFFCYK